MLNPSTYKPKLPVHNFQTYLVGRGDTRDGRAEKFVLDPDTLLGCSPLLSEDSAAFMTGTELIILPFDGTLHDVSPGETLEGLGRPLAEHLLRDEEYHRLVRAQAPFSGIH